MSRDFDVIVIGSGIAGHCAALEALMAGSSVLMLEAEPIVGGSSRLSTGMIMGAGTRFQRERGIEDDPERLYRHYITANQWIVQPSVARRLCYDVGPTIEWLNDRGVKILDVISSGEEDRPRGHVTEGGAAIVAALGGHIGNHDKIDTAVKSRVERLVVENGAVTGVEVNGDEIRAGAVVIATGGFAANHELVARWYPDVIPMAAGQLHHQGTPWALGDAFKFADQAKAQIAWGTGSRSPMWSFGGGYLPTFVIVVNQLGRRFFPETASYSASEIAIRSQLSGISYFIFDDGIKQAMKTIADVKRYTKLILPETDHLLSTWTSNGIDDLVARGDIIKADSAEQLAQRIGVPPDNLKGTLERYNQHVAKGEDSDYFKDVTGVAPLNTPPYYATQVKMHMLSLTAVGPRVDHEAQVMHETSLPVPGLYAAGECVGGVLGSIYVGSGNSVGNCSTYGRIAGRNAAAYAKTH